MVQWLCYGLGYPVFNPCQQGGKNLNLNVWNALTGTEAYPASYSMGTWSFAGVNRPGRRVDHPPPFGAEVQESVELSLSLWNIMACAGVYFTFSSFHLLRTMLASSAPWRMSLLRKLIVVAESLKQLEWLWVADDE